MISCEKFFLFQMFLLIIKYEFLNNNLLNIGEGISRYVIVYKVVY